MSNKVTDDPSTIQVRRRHPDGVTVPFSIPGMTSGSATHRREPTGTSASPDDSSGVRRLYTVTMMADVLGAPPAAVRHWVRTGLLKAVRRSGSIEWFDFRQLVVGKTLVRLLSGGLSLREIDAKLDTLAPGGAREAAQICERIVTDGRRLSIRRDGRLVGGGGQLQFGFYVDGLQRHEAEPQPLPAVLSPRTVEVAVEDVVPQPDEPTCVTDLVELAADLETAGEFTEAAEALRAALQAGGADARIVFMLAELLYRMGDLTAARERYYAAVELDADHLEARTSLGCVLAELGEHELALAALEGVLRQEPDYADAHWHMAGVLFDIGRPAAARRKLRTFLTLAPESPWAALARERLR